MERINFRKIVFYVFAGMISIVLFLLMIPVEILILIIDILCQIINKTAKWVRW